MKHSINSEFKNLLPPWASRDLRFALVKYGGGIVEMAGSIAGTTFARNRYGKYARARSKPTNPNTDAQVAVRSAVAALVNRWAQTLNSTQRAAWALYADNVVMKNRLGEDMKLSGFNHYIRSNAISKRMHNTQVDDGPVIFEIPEHDPTLAVAGSEATQDLTMTYDDTLAWDNETGGYLTFFQGKPQNAQRNFFAGPWIAFAEVAGVDGVPVASPKVQAALFAIAEGQHQWIYARIRRADGRLSEPFRADSYTGA